jgi:hypothetical protein
MSHVCYGYLADIPTSSQVVFDWELVRISRNDFFGCIDPDFDSDVITT